MKVNQNKTKLNEKTKPPQKTQPTTPPTKTPKQTKNQTPNIPHQNKIKQMTDLLTEH